MLAKAIERGLQRLARPWNRLRAISVFRDDSDLRPSAHLWGSIQSTLDESKWFVLLACPESAASPWVNKEVEHWCEAKGPERIILVVTGGQIAWDSARTDFTAESTCIPAALRGRYADEPLYVDLRWARDEPDLSMRIPKFREAVAHIASPIRGVAPEDLESEDIRQYRRARTLRRAAVVGLAVLAVTATLAAVVAVNNARRADRRTREAIGRQLGLASLDLPPDRIDSALLLSLAGAELADSGAGDRFQVSRTLIGRYSRLEGLLHTVPVDGAASSGAGGAAPDTSGGLRSVRGLALDASATTAAAVMWESGVPMSLLVWRVASPAAPARVQLPGGFATGSDAVAMRFVAADRIVIAHVGSPLVVAFVGGDATVPTVALEDGPAGNAVAFDLSTGRAVLSDGPRVALVDLAAPDEVVAQVDDAAVAVAADHGRVGVLLSSGLVVIDPDGTEHRADRGTVGAASPESIAIGTDADLAAIAVDSRGVLTGWRIDGPKLVEVFRGAVDGSVGRVQRLVASANGARALLIGDQGTAAIDLPSLRTSATDPTASGPLSVDPSGRFAAVGGRRLAVWDMVTGQRIIAVPQEATSLLWHGTCDGDDACTLISAGETVDVWYPLSGRQIRLAEATNAQAIAVSDGTDRVLTAGWGSTVALWTLTPRIDAKAMSEVVAAGSRATTISPVPGGEGDPAIARFDGTSIVTVTVGNRVHEVNTGALDRMLLSTNGSRLVSLLGRDVTLWDTTGDVPVALHSMCAQPMLALSPDGSRLVAYEPNSHVIAVCDTTTGSRVATGNVSKAEVQPVSALAVDDSGAVLAGGGAGFITVFTPTAEGSFRGLGVDVRFGGEDAVVRSVAWRGGIAVAGVASTGARGEPARAVIWNVADAGTPNVFDLDFTDVPAVALLGDDAALLAVAGRDGPTGEVTVQLWQTATRRRLGSAFGGLRGDVVMLTGDPLNVFGADSSGRIVRWVVSDDPTAEVCAVVGRPLRADEWDAALGGALRSYPFTPTCA